MRRQLQLMLLIWLALGSLRCAAAESLPETITPAMWLKAQPRPHFRRGYTLPPLTRFGWTLPLDARIELTEHWGYALEFGGYADRETVEKALADPRSDESRLVALCASDPKRYPLAVICSRALPTGDLPEVWTRDQSGRFLDGSAQSLDGNKWQPDMHTVFSPESPNTFWQKAGELRAAPLRKIREKCPIAIVLNGGEYGLSVLGSAQTIWERDPRIVAAKGERPWFDYISERKAHCELLIAEGIRQAVPDRLLYIYYTAGGGTHRNSSWVWRKWEFGWEWMKNVSDVPSNDCYYHFFNDGWTGSQDMLTLVLNAAAREITDGKPLSYNWVCAGWPRTELKRDGGLGDLARWTGFLKCYYTAGMIGANAGYYALPPGGFEARFPSNSPPHWLQQMVRLAHVHALFSNLEDFLREGDLLPGPNNHRMSTELPAYEFPTDDSTIRVLARKHRRNPEWLVTAWAAAGNARDVTVTIPELGKLKLYARPSGAVYRVTKEEDGSPSLQLMDADGMFPTASF